jgi:hypothetical protein
VSDDLTIDTGGQPPTPAAAPDAGGPDGPPALPPHSDQVAAATGSGLAARLQAGVRQLQASRTKDFDVPGWDGDLQIRARKLDEPTIDKADSALKTIALATETVLLREHDGAPYSELSWRQIGDTMGVPPETTVTEIVAGVFDRNGAAIRVFCGELLAWMAGRQSAIDQLLGE